MTDLDATVASFTPTRSPSADRSSASEPSPTPTPTPSDDASRSPRVIVTPGRDLDAAASRAARRDAELSAREAALAEREAALALERAALASAREAASESTSRVAAETTVACNTAAKSKAMNAAVAAELNRREDALSRREDEIAARERRETSAALREREDVVAEREKRAAAVEAQLDAKLAEAERAEAARGAAARDAIETVTANLERRAAEVASAQVQSDERARVADDRLKAADELHTSLEARERAATERESALSQLQDAVEQRSEALREAGRERGEALEAMQITLKAREEALKAVEAQLAESRARARETATSQGGGGGGGGGGGDDLSEDAVQMLHVLQLKLQLAEAERAAAEDKTNEMERRCEQFEAVATAATDLASKLEATVSTQQRVLETLNENGAGESSELELANAEIARLKLMNNGAGGGVGEENKDEEIATLKRALRLAAERAAAAEKAAKAAIARVTAHAKAQKNGEMDALRATHDAEVAAAVAKVSKGTAIEDWVAIADDARRERDDIAEELRVASAASARAAAVSEKLDVRTATLAATTAALEEVVRSSHGGWVLASSQESPRAAPKNDDDASEDHMAVLDYLCSVARERFKDDGDGGDGGRDLFEGGKLEARARVAVKDVTRALTEAAAAAAAGGAIKSKCPRRIT
jgi:chromosome segregation ATPase